MRSSLRYHVRFSLIYVLHWKLDIIPLIICKLRNLRDLNFKFYLRNYLGMTEEHLSTHPEIIEIRNTVSDNSGFV